ncbi:hypothetical protein [Streptomyces sp. NBC_00391]|uniref:hypothetical protein n=1 Tax=Streptomyces sp. NBC_00391 TaxID=2903647 RepID=UPI002E242AE1
MPDEPYGQYNSGCHFDQQGQHVHGPQYNADEIRINQADPQSIADGMARDRQRRQAQQDALRQRDVRAYAAAEQNAMKWTWRILGFSLVVFFLFAILQGVVGGI